MSLTESPGRSTHTIHDLQKAVSDEIEAVFTPAIPEQLFSRAAHLYQIDKLSYVGKRGLGLMFLMTLALAIMATMQGPNSLEMSARLALWGAMCLGSFGIAFSGLHAFRAGKAVTRKPLSWQASMTARLAVTGVAFATSAYLLTPTTAPVAMTIFIPITVIATSLVAAFAFSSHRASAQAIALPGLFLGLPAFAEHINSITATVGVALLASLAMMFLHIQCSQKLRTARRLHPRRRLQDLYQEHRKPHLSKAYNPYRMPEIDEPSMAINQ